MLLKRLASSFEAAMQATLRSLVGNNKKVALQYGTTEKFFKTFVFINASYTTIPYNTMHISGTASFSDRIRFGSTPLYFLNL
jgi:hypothetical protein